MALIFSGGREISGSWLHFFFGVYCVQEVPTDFVS